jgi:FAD/FMN-containing dehydrogenase
MLEQQQKHNDITEQLKTIVGAEWVSDSAEELFVYSYDMTENLPGKPDYVVMPKTVEEIQAIVQLANTHKIPIVPFIAGANVGGLTIPLRGGIILDLKRMDQILRFDEDDMYVIVEPGVTFGHINKFLNNTKYRYCYPNAPPYTSIMANALLGGLNNLSIKYGAMSDIINGVEAVLPTGEVVKIGTCACWDEHWWGRGPMPDLLGLFINWQGMSGIVTKIALQVWPKRPIREWVTIACFSLEESYKLVKKLTRSDIADDIMWVSAETLKMIIGVPIGEAQISVDDPLPAFYAMIDISANTPKEFEAKLDYIQTEMEELNKVDPKAFQTTAAIAGQMFGNKVTDLQNLPISIAGMLEYGGLTWVGTYMTTKTETVIKGVKTAFDIIEKHGFEKCLYTRMMKGGHFFAFRFLLRFSKENEEEIARMRSLTKELFETLFEQSAMPYKTPLWATKTILERCDPNWVKLFKKVKKTLDPNGIMNPGRWGTDIE